MATSRGKADSQLPSQSDQLLSPASYDSFEQDIDLSATVLNGELHPRQILRLQRTIGNRRVSEMIQRQQNATGIQRENGGASSSSAASKPPPPSTRSPRQPLPASQAAVAPGVAVSSSSVPLASQSSHQQPAIPARPQMLPVESQAFYFGPDDVFKCQIADVNGFKYTIKLGDGRTLTDIPRDKVSKNPPLTPKPQMLPVNSWAFYTGQEGRQRCQITGISGFTYTIQLNGGQILTDVPRDQVSKTPPLPPKPRELEINTWVFYRGEKEVEDHFCKIIGRSGYKYQLQLSDGRIVDDVSENELESVNAFIDSANLDQDKSKTDKGLEQAAKFTSPLSQAAGLGGDSASIGDPTQLEFSLSKDRLQYDTSHRIDKSKGKLEFGSDDDRARVGASASFFSFGASGLNSFGDFLGMVQSIKELKTEEELEKQIEAGLKLGVSGLKSITGALQSVSGLAGGIAGAVSVGQSTSSDAAKAATSFNGIVDSFGAIGNVLTPIKGTTDLLLHTYYGIKELAVDKDISKAEFAQTRLPQLFQDGIVIGESLLSIAKDALSATRFFLSVADAGGEFVSAFPIIGACLKIALSLLDILRQTIDVITRGIAVFQAGRAMSSMKDLRQKYQTDPEKYQLFESSRYINQKRVGRQIVPIVGDGVVILADLNSIVAAVLQIAGVASSAAYGSGLALVGTSYGLTGVTIATKTSVSATNLGMKGFRHVKQGLRDLGGMSDEYQEFYSKAKYGMHGKLGELAQKSILPNPDKTSETKDEDYKKKATYILKWMLNLPPLGWKATEVKAKLANPATIPESERKIVPEYQDVFSLLDALQVNKRELFKLNGDPAAQIRLMIKGMKKRE